MSVIVCVLFECGVLCLIVVPLPLGKNPFAVQLNNKKKRQVPIELSLCMYGIQFTLCFFANLEQ
jgi:hypothetical protein